MGKYKALQDDVFSIFNANYWKSEGIPTYPSNFSNLGGENEFIRVAIIPSGKGINLVSASGVLIVDIFTPAGDGPTRASLIADKLDSYLAGKSVTPVTKTRTQFGSSSLTFDGVDRSDSTLYRSTFTISFNYFGASQ